MPTPDTSKDWEAVAFESYEKDGEKKWKRNFICNLVPDKNGGEGFMLYIPKHMALMGRVRLQPKQEKDTPTNDL